MWSRIVKNISKNKRIIALGIAIAVVAVYFIPNTWVFAGRGTSLFNPQATTTTTTSGSDPSVVTQHQGGFTQPVITQHQCGVPARSGSYGCGGNAPSGFLP